MINPFQSRMETIIGPCEEVTMQVDFLQGHDIE
jgi:hypothetical protein